MGLGIGVTCYGSDGGGGLPSMVVRLGVAYLPLDLGLSSSYNLGGKNAMECSIY